MAKMDLADLKSLLQEQKTNALGGLTATVIAT